MTPAFAVSGLSKRYPDFALENVSLSLQPGMVMGLVGANGAGKTTLLRLLSGLAAADSGTIEVLGHRMPEAQAEARRDVGLASEDMRLYRGQSLDWHIDLVRRIYPSWDDDYASALMRRFDLRSQQSLGGYSHGQRVKALLLLCLARRPRLLLLDEPTTGLDPVARLEVLEALADVLRDEQRSVLFSSHNTADVEQMADRIAFLHRGHLVADADKEQFLEQWRRVLCIGSPPPTLAGWPEIAAVRSSGSQNEIRVRNWHASLPGRLADAGLRVERIDPMSLEEIFVTAVRTGGAA
jgi:ABC-2 type transport system ATP-binding protein